MSLSLCNSQVYLPFIVGVGHIDFGDLNTLTFPFHMVYPDFSLFAAATKADGFALYFLGECNNVSAEHFC